MANTITFSGLSSGLDTSSWIEALVSVKQTTITSLQTANSIQESLLNVVSNIKSFFTSFQNCLQKITDSSFGINSMDLFMQNIASSSNIAIATASATTEAARQSYDVLVEQLATATKAQSGYKTTETVKVGLDTELSKLGVSDGTITVNNQSFGLKSTDTIKDLIEKFSDVGVVASFDTKRSRFTVSYAVGDIDDGTTGLKNALKLQDTAVNGYSTSAMKYADGATRLNDLGVTSGQIKINGDTYTIGTSGVDTVISGNGYTNSNIRDLDSLFAFLRDELGATEALIDEQGRVSIRGVTIEAVDGGSNLMEALNLDAGTNYVVMQSGILDYHQQRLADADTLLSDLGINGSDTITLPGYSSTIAATGMVTLGQLLEALSNGTTITTSIDNGVITVYDPDHIMDSITGTAIDKLGLSSTEFGTTLVSGAHTVVDSTSSTSDSEILKDVHYGITSSTTFASILGCADGDTFTLEVDGTSVPGITGASQLSALEAAVVAAGGTFTINDGDSITIDGVTLGGTLIDALGMAAVGQSTSVQSSPLSIVSSETSTNTSTSPVSQTVAVDITGGTKLSQILGGTDATAYTFSIDGSSVAGITGATTLDDLKTIIEDDYHGSFVINPDNTLTITGLTNLSGTLATALGLESTAEGTEVYSSSLSYLSSISSNMTSNQEVNETIRSRITLDTTLSELGITGTNALTIDGSNATPSNYNISDDKTLGYIKNLVENNINGGSFVINDDNTITISGVTISGTLAEALGFAAVDDGTTISSNKIYYTSSVSSTVAGRTPIVQTTHNDISESTKLSQILGSTDATTYTFKIGSKTINGITGATTLGDLKTIIEDDNGGRFYINSDNTITIAELKNLSGTLVTKLGLSATGQGSEVCSSAITYVSTNNSQMASGAPIQQYSGMVITDDTTVKELVGGVDTDAYTINSYNVTGATTIGELRALISPDGGIITANDDGSITISGMSSLTGTLPTALKMNVVAQGTQIQSRDAVQYIQRVTSSVTSAFSLRAKKEGSGATTSATIADVFGGLSTKTYILKVNGTAISGLKGSSTFNDIKTAVEAAGGTFSLTSGEMKISGVTLSGNFMDLLNEKQLSVSGSPLRYDISESMSLDELAANGQVGRIAGYTRLTQAEAEAKGYVWVTSASDLDSAIAQNKRICLGQDIDLSGVSWTSRNFSGELNGNGYKIQNLSCLAEMNNIGLFATVGSGGVVKDLIFENGWVHSGIGNTAGMLAGTLSAGSCVDNIYILDGLVEGKYTVGALAGYVDGATVGNIYSDTVVRTNGTRNNAGDDSETGGIIGLTNGAVNISNLYCSGNVSGKIKVGGVIGCLGSGAASVSNLYGCGQVTADGTGTEESKTAAGVVYTANSNISNAYSGATINAHDQYAVVGTLADNTNLSNYINNTEYAEVGPVGTDTLETEASYDLATALAVSNHDGNYARATAYTTMSELGLTGGGDLRLSLDGVETVLSFNGADTINDVITSLSNYGITASIDNTGVMTFSRQDGVGQFAISGSVGNLLTSNSKGRSYSLKKIVSSNITDSTTLEAIGIKSGEIEVKDKDNNVIGRVNVDSSQSLEDVLEILKIQYGINWSISSDKLTLSSSDGCYIADYSTNFTNMLGVELVSLNDLTKNRIQSMTKLTKAEAEAAGYVWVTSGDDLKQAIADGAKICLGANIQLGYMNDWLITELPTLQSELNGNGCTISIYTYTGSGEISGTDYVGIFKEIKSNGFVRNLVISGVKVNATGDNVGVLAGKNGGIIENVYLDSCEVSGTKYVGTLVGQNTGTVKNVGTRNSVYSGTENVGGLIGYNRGNVNNAYVSNYNNTSFSHATAIGGVIGYNIGNNVKNIYVSGYTYMGASYVDGIGVVIGHNRGNLEKVYIGDIMASSFDYSTITNIGNVIGFNSSAHTLSDCIIRTRHNALNDIGNNTGTITMASYKYDEALSDKYGLTYTRRGLSTTTKLSDLGFTEGSTMKVVINATDEYNLSFSADDTMANVFDTLSRYGITVSITDNKLKLSGYGTGTCFALSGELGNFLTQNTTISTNDCISQSRQYYTPSSVNENTILSNIGVKSGTVVVKDDAGNTLGYVNVDNSINLFQAANLFADYGIAGSVSSDGKVTYTSENGYYLVDGSSDMLSKFNIAHVVAINDLSSTSTLYPTALTQAEAEAQGYTWVTTIDELQKALQKNDRICLGSNLAFDATTSAAWVSVTNFSGELNGNGHSIQGLTLNTSDNDTALIASTTSTAVVKNLNCFFMRVTGKERTGIIVGDNAGEISNIYLYHSTVTGTSSNTGAVAGRNSGTISNIYLFDTIHVNGTGYTGGVTGSSSGSIANVYSRATVDAPANNYVGGIVGSLSGSCHNVCQEDGEVTGNDIVGGIAGTVTSTGTLSNIYVYARTNSGAGATRVGGMVGVYDSSATVYNAVDNAYVASSTTTGNGKDDLFVTAGYTYADGVNNPNSAQVKLISPISGSTCLNEIGFADGGNINLIIDGATPYTLSFRGNDSLQDVMNVLNTYGVEMTIGDDGKISMKSAMCSTGYHTFTVSGGLGSYLTQGGTLTNTNSYYTSSDLGYSTTSQATNASLVGECGVTSGTVLVKDYMGNVIGSVDVDGSMTMNQLLNSFREYGITSTLSSGKVTFSSANGNYLDDGSSNMVSKFGCKVMSLNDLKSNADMEHISGLTQLTRAEAEAQGYTWVTNWYQLSAALTANPAAKICLGADFDLGADATPPSDFGTFDISGEINGNGFAIADNRSRTINACGIFKSITSTGYVHDLFIKNVSFEYNDSNNVGVLAGQNKGTIDNVYVINSSVTSTKNNIGGLVGYSYGLGKISNVFVNAAVTGDTCVGGVVGVSDGDLINAYSYNGINEANIYGTGNVGGVIGSTHGTVRNVYRDGAYVTGTAGYTGGVVGYCYGVVENAYATLLGYISGPAGKMDSIVGYNDRSCSNVIADDPSPYATGIHGSIPSPYDLNTALNMASSNHYDLQSIGIHNTLSSLGFTDGGTVNIILDGRTPYTLEFTANDTLQDVFDVLNTYGISARIQSNSIYLKSNNTDTGVHTFTMGGTLGNYLTQGGNYTTVDRQFTSADQTQYSSATVTGSSVLADCGVQSGSVLVKDSNGNTIANVNIDNSANINQVLSMFSEYGIMGDLSSGKVTFSSNNGNYLEDGMSNMLSAFHISPAMSLNELKANAIHYSIAGYTRLTQAEAEAQGYTWVTTSEELAAALANNENICLGSNSMNVASSVYAASYSGELNGNGCTLYLNGTRTNGLIGTTTSTAVVKNIFIDNCNIQNSDYNVAVGALVGENNGLIENAYVTPGIVKATGDLSKAGGVVGENKGQVINVYNRATVSSTGSVGAAGGIIGYASSGSTLQNAYNYGNVTGESSAGGIIGYSNVSNIKNVYSYAKIQSTQNAGGAVGVCSSGNVSKVYVTESGSYNITGANAGLIFGQALGASKIENVIGETDQGTRYVASGVRPLDIQYDLEDALNRKSVVTTAYDKITTSTTLDQMGFNTGSIINLTLDGTTPYSLAFSREDTLQDVFDVLAVYGIEGLVDADGRVAFHSQNNGSEIHSFAMSGALANFLTTGGTYDNNDRQYTSSDLTIHNISNVTDSSVLSDCCISSGSVIVKDKSGNVIGTVNIDNSMILAQALNSFREYGISGSVTDGKITFTSTNGNTLADGSSNMISRLGCQSLSLNDLAANATSKNISGFTKLTQAEAEALGYVWVTNGADLKTALSGSNANTKVCLGGDIDLTSIAWGNGIADWKGVFEGNGYTISGLSASLQGATAGAGLFRNIDGGTVKNLFIENAQISKASGTGLKMGVLAGYAGNNTTIDNVYVVGGTVDSSGKDYAGGLIGSLNNNASNINISNVYNSATVSGKNNVGGIVAYANNVDYKITNAYNAGNITGSDSTVGGVAGYITGRSAQNSEISNIYNSGSITGNSYVGGCIGNSSYADVTNVYNSGTVTGSTETGGVAGCFYVRSSPTDYIDTSGAARAVGYGSSGTAATYSLSEGMSQQASVNVSHGVLGMNTTVSQMGFENGGTVNIILDGTTPYSLSFGAGDKMQDISDVLAIYGINTTVDADGKVTFTSPDHSFTMGGALGSYLTNGGTFNTQDAHYASGDLSYTRQENADNLTVLADCGVRSGTVYVKDSQGNIVDTLNIDNSLTIGEFATLLNNGYGMQTTWESDGIAKIVSDRGYSLSDGTSNIVSKTNLNTWESETSSLETTHTFAQMGFSNGANLRLVKDGSTSYSFDFSAFDTLQDVFDTLSTQGIHADINADGEITLTSLNSTFTLGGQLGSYLTDGGAYQNHTTGLASDPIVYTKGEGQDLTYNTKLVDLGVQTGNINVIQNGVVAAAIDINDQTTLQQLFNAIKPYGITGSIKNSDDDVYLYLDSDGLNYIANGTSDVVTALGLNLLNKTEYHGASVTLNDSTATSGLLAEDMLLSNFNKNGAIAAGSLIFTLGSGADSVQKIINITDTETVGSLIEKLNDAGAHAELVNGEIKLDNSVYGINITGGTSGIVTTLGLNATTVATYASSSEDLKYTDEAVLSASKYADQNTKLGTVSITAGKLSVYFDNKKATVNVETTDTFDTLFGKITAAAATVGVTATAGFLDANGNIITNYSLLDAESTGVIGIKVGDGHTVKVGASNDTTNLATIANFQQESDTSANGTRILYKVGVDSKVMDTGLFRNGNVTAGTFTIGDAEFTIDANTTIANLVTLINKSDKSYASAYWDSLAGTLVLQSTISGESLMNIGSDTDTSNFAKVMGLVAADGSLVSDMQTLGQNALVRINGTQVSSSSNTITSDVSRIDGLTINLKGLSNGEHVTIDVKQDTENIYNAVSDVVDAYNNMMQELEKDVNAGGAFASDSLLKMMKNNLKRLMTSTVANIGVFKNMSAIGISTGDAKESMISTNVTSLVIDKEKFMLALDSDSDSVKYLLVGSPGQKGVLSQAYDIVSKALNSGGLLTNMEKSYQTKIQANNKKITKLSDALEAYRLSLTNKFKNMESIINKMQQSYSSFLSF